MKNPLQQFVPVEERDTGVFITVDRTQKQSLDVKAMIAALQEAGVTNYRSDEIVAAVKRARGAPEKIGPPFEYYPRDFDAYASLKITGHAALLCVNEQCTEHGAEPTASILRAFLKKKGVIAGIDEDALNAIASGEKFGQYVPVAHDIPPQQGEPGSIEVKIDTRPDFRPKVGANGRVDFKEVNTYIEVEKGSVLAIRTPPKPGVPGRKVTGEEIAPTPGKDVSLPAGKNTCVDEEGRTLYAAETGILIEDKGLLTVRETFCINGDVDFRVGNVKYSGNVCINGHVRAGFSVEAEGNVEVKGSVESARIVSRNATVTVHGGVLGKDDTYLYAKKGLDIAFAQSSTFETEARMRVHKHLLHCKVTCNRFVAEQSTGNVLGGKVVAYKSVEVYDIGNSKGVDTHIVLVNRQREVYKEQLKKLQQLRTQLDEKIAPVKKELNAKAAIFKKAGDAVTARHKKELKKWIDAYNDLSGKAKYVDEKIDQMREKVKNPIDPEGYVTVLHCAYPGTVLSLYGKEKKLRTEETHITYRATETDIRSSHTKEGQ